MTILYCILSFLLGVGLTVAVTIWIMKRKAMKMAGKMMETFSTGLLSNLNTMQPVHLENMKSLETILSDLHSRKNSEVTPIDVTDFKIINSDESDKNS